MFPDELPQELPVADRVVYVENIVNVHDVLYPLDPEDMNESVRSLSGTLEILMEDYAIELGFLFTGLNVTVYFWRCGDLLYLFDPHAVNENRQFDLVDDSNNLARLFRCDNYSSLASLLLSNVVFDGNIRQFSVTQLKFSIPAGPVLRMEASVPSDCNVVRGDVKLTLLRPVVVLSPLRKVKSLPDLDSIKQGPGRQRKRK